MTPLQQRFVDEYTVDGNGAAAARRAGYSATSARQEAYKLLANEEVKLAIQERLSSLSMSADMAIKQISDIAKTRLNDYLEVKQVMRAPTIKKSLSVLIEEIEAEMKFEQEYHDLAEVDEGDLKRFEQQQKGRRNTIVRYNLELERNPNAFREVAGDPVPVEEVSIDMVALAKSKELGRIKTLSYGEFGPKVEMYAADASLGKILEYHGKIKSPGETTVNVIITPDDVKAFREAFNDKY